MKVKSLERLVEDYKMVSHDHQENSYYDKQLDRYFNPDTYDIPLSNASGSQYLSQLGNEICSWLFPADGSWMKITPKDESTEAVQKAHKLSKVIRRKLQRSNFYLEMSQLIHNVLIYNKGFIHSHYNHGLVFRSEAISNPGFFIAEFVDEASQRGYFELEETSMSIMERFEMTPDIMEFIESATYSSNKDLAKYKLVECIIPNNKYFVESNDSKYRWVKVTLIHNGGEYRVLTPKGPHVGFTAFPIVSCTSQRFKSLAYEGLSSAILLNRMEMLRLERAEQTLNPDYVVGQETYMSNAFDPQDPSQVIQVANHERDPSPLITGNELPITLEDIQFKERKLREIFSIDLIERLKIVNVSQFEHHANRLKFFTFIAPLISNLLNTSITTVVERAVKTLASYDKDVKGFSKDMDIETDHLATLTEESQRAMNYARFAQAATFFLQVAPESRTVMNPDMALKDLAKIYGLQGMLLPDEQVAQIREAQARQIQQQQQQEQAKLASEAEANQAQADTTRQKGGL